MPRLRSNLSAAAWLACCVLTIGVSHGEQPATPWGSSSSEGDATVADWATTKFAKQPAKKPAGRDVTPVPPSEESDLPPSQLAMAPGQAPAPFPPPPGDRYGDSAAKTTRLASPQDGPLPSGNPLRGAAEPPIRIEVAAETTEPAAESDFNPSPAPPAPFEPGETEQLAEPARIAIGATPIDPTPSAEVANAPVPPAPWSEQAAPSRPSDATPPAEEPAPIRVAAVAMADATEEPAEFQSSYQSEFQAAEPLQAVSTEGTGQPGSTDLEGPQEASLIIEKRGPSEARIGQACRFAIRVRNTGRGTAENVTLTDQVPSGAKLIGTKPTADHQGGQLVWRLGAIAEGEERTVEMRVEPTREGPLGSVAQVTMAAAASASTVCTRPELAVRISAPPRVLIGEEQIVTIEVHNPGTGAATNVMLTENVPSAVRHPAGSELEFEVGTLEPGATRQINLKLTAAEAGHVINAVTIVADGDLRAEKQVEFDIIAPSLAVSIDGPKRRYLERPANYTIGVDNPGTAPAKDVRLVTVLPRGMDFVKANNLGEYDATTHSVYWSLAELPEGERGEVQITAMPTTAGEHTVKVESKAASGLEAKQAHQVRVEGIASLAFEVRDLQDPIEVGGETIYEVRVLNEGTKAATAVVVRVEAPTGLKIVAAEGQTAARTNAGRAEFAPLAKLDPGEKAAYRVRVTGAEPGDQRLTVLVESAELTRPIRREESTRVYGNE